MKTAATETAQQPVILLVDDNEANIGVLINYLKESGFNAITARNGEMGLKRAQFTQPDLILLDVMMPGINGFEVCQRLKADPATKDIPVIFMTALSEVEHQVQGFTVGGVDYITKPIQREVVIARIRAHVRIQAQQRQLQQQATELHHAKDAALEAQRRAEAAQRASEAANQAKSVFLSNMSHELRTPLNVILGFSQIMGHNPALPPEEQEHLDTIQRNGDHLLALINQVLDFSKIEAGRITLNETAFDLYRLCEDMIDMFSLRTGQKGLQLSREIAGNVPRYVRTDEVKLRQVLINLLNNAIKFTSQGRVGIEVAVVDADDTALTSPAPTTGQAAIIRIAVSDTGAGIAPEEMDALFEAFAQTESGRQLHEGTGLGLPISRAFVRLMGGDLHVTSEVGRGTTFRFTIHAAVAGKHDLPGASAPARPVAQEAGQPRHRMLIVDDKPDNRILLLKLLQPFGFELREAVNGQDAVEQWKAWQPELIWMDLRMPVMGGYDAMRLIRAAEQAAPRPPTRIVILSASSLEEERATALAKGADDFLRKPFREAELFELVARLLDVRFVYDAAPGQHLSAEEAELLPPDFAAAALAELPAALRERLEEAAREGVVSMVNAAIADIAPHDPRVAQWLQSLAADFAYESIIEALQKGAVSHLTPATLAQLPESWYGPLKLAVEAIDPPAIDAIVAEIRPQYAGLANELSALVKQYRFDLLHALFEDGEMEDRQTDRLP